MQRNFRRVCLLLFLSLVTSSSRAAILRVKADAPGPAHDGATWQSAFATITSGLAAAAPGDEVWVASGVYQERITLPAGVSLYGGFAGNETDRAQADPAVNASVIYGGGQPRVITIAPGAGPDTVLDGMSVQSGAIDHSDMEHAGGILCEDASPTIRNNVIAGIVMGHDSSGPFRGGWELGGMGAGLYLARSNAVVENNTFRENQATAGGAIYCLGGAPTFRANTFTANSASYGAVLYADGSVLTFTGNQATGGGIYLANGVSGVISGNDLANSIPSISGAGVMCNASSPQIIDNIIRDHNDVPAVSCYNGAAPLISGNTFTGNSRGAISCSGASPTIVRNTLMQNGGVLIGSVIYGALVCNGDSAPLIADNVIAANSSGGIACLSGSSPRIFNNTLVSNGAGIRIYAGSLARIVNNIIAYHGTGVYTDPASPAAAEIRNNCVFANTSANYFGLPDPTGTDGNIAADPLFANPAHRHYHIQPNSPCVDAGDNSVVSSGDLDMDGQARTQGSRVDIGADESDGTVWNDPDRVIHVKPGGDDENDGSDWSHAKATVLSALSAAQGRDEIWVAAGTYTGQHTLPAGISLYGGFAGTETAREQANPSAHRSILDGGAAGAVVRGGAGTWTGSVLDGFIIRNANTTPAVSAGTLTVRRCEIRDNAGPGVQLGVNSIVENCVVTDNAGLGVSAAAVRRCIIERNAGGGVNATNGVSGPTFVENNRIISNGVASVATVGGVASASGAVVRNNLIALNQGRSVGGITGGSAALVVNNTIVANSAPVSGIGGLAAEPITGVVANNIIAYNSSGARIHMYVGGSFRNNDVFGNSGRDYVVATDRTGTDGNISVDPKFASLTARNFHLQASSPLVDAGDSTLAQAGDLDIDGQPRIQGAAMDIGADESDGTTWNIPTAIVRVRPDGNDGADGSTWQAAKATVAAAVSAIRQTGGEVWIAGGTYPGPVSTGSFVSLYGGFKGTESTRSERDGTAVSTLTGDGSGPVLTLTGYLSGAVDGLTISGGKTGVLLNQTDARLSHLTVVHNGEGVAVADGPLFLEDSVVSDNDGPAVNGAIVAAVAVHRNTIERNGAPAGPVASGAVPAAVMISYTSGAHPMEISGNTIRNNDTNGIAVGGNSAGLIADNLIEGNSTPGDGGGIVVSGANYYPPPGGRIPALQILRNRVMRNRAGNGGGIWSYTANVELTNNVVTDNFGFFKARGVNIGVNSGTGGPVTLTGNVIGNNSGAADSAGIASTISVIAYNNTIAGHQTALSVSGTVTRLDLVNNILADNGQTSTLKPRIFRNNCEWNAQNLLPNQIPAGATGNIVADPRLARMITGNYHIQPNSPCVDAGDDSVVPAGATDIDGQPRIQGAHVDIGADESDGTAWPVTPLVLHVRPDGADANDGLTWTTAKRSIAAAYFSAVPGDEVWVAAGTYQSAAPLQLAEGVSLYGGFAGREARRTDRYPVANVTALKGSNSSVVVAPPGVTSATVLDGFTISGGRGTPRDTALYGGGVFCDQSSPTISNNVITQNLMTAGRGFGAGIAVLNGSPNIIGNVISANRVSVHSTLGGGGGGVAVIGGSPLLTGNVISGNTTTGVTTGPVGGGLYVSGAQPIIAGNHFEANANAVAIAKDVETAITWNTFQNGGNMDISAASNLEVAGNSFERARDYAIGSDGVAVNIHGNEIAGSQGPGIRVVGGTAKIASNVIRGGAGIMGVGINTANASATITGNVITKNTGSMGAAMSLGTNAGVPVTVKLTGNEITDNTSTGAGVVIRAGSPDMQLEVSGNMISGNKSNQFIADLYGSPIVHGNRVEGNFLTTTGSNIVMRVRDAQVRDNVFSGNRGFDAGITVVNAINCDVVGNTFVGNGIPGGADAVYAYGSRVVNNIVAFNDYGISGPYGPSAPTLRNNLVYGNQRGNFRLIADPTGTNGNISVDPLFVDRAGGNYRLADGSPAINAGDDSVVLPGELDADMSARLLGPHVDIGAFEAANLNPGLLADTLRALRIAGGLETAVASSLADLDTDTSGRIEVQDATRLMRRAIGLETP